MKDTRTVEELRAEIVDLKHQLAQAVAVTCSYAQGHVCPLLDMLNVRQIWHESGEDE